MASLPPLSEASTLCRGTAQVMLQTAYLDYREPTCEIAQFDEGMGNADVPDPLLTAHRLARFYLVGAGEFVYSIGTLLQEESPLPLSISTLARSTAEYASRCKYISEPSDGPEMRISKLCNLFHEGFKNIGVNKPDADPARVQLAKAFETWKSRHRLPRSRLPNYTDLIDKLSPAMGVKKYDALSGFAHGNALTVGVTVVMAQINHERRHEDLWQHSLFAAQCGLLAANQVCYLRDGDMEPLEHVRTLLDHWITLYNRYLWDLSAEMGYPLEIPRP